MRYFFPGMWRALFGRKLGATVRRGPRVAVYVLHHKVHDGGRLYFLFSEAPHGHLLGPMVAKLSEMHCVIGGSIDVSPHSVTVEWSPFVGTGQREEHLIADIRLTVFELLLGTWEPSYKQFNIMGSDLASTVRQLSRQSDTDWAGELRIQNA